jgi:hypothetical protein
LRVVDDIGLFVALDDGLWGIVHLNDLDQKKVARSRLSAMRWERLSR